MFSRRNLQHPSPWKKMEAGNYSETSVLNYQVTRRRITEGHNLNTRHRGNLKPHKNIS
jgi:hypothetical protein